MGMRAAQRHEALPKLHCCADDKNAEPKEAENDKNAEFEKARFDKNAEVEPSSAPAGF